MSGDQTALDLNQPSPVRPPALSRDAVVRAHNIVAYSNSHPFHPVITTELLQVARSIVETFEVPTPFRNRRRANVVLPEKGIRFIPGPRRASFEANGELGYPSAWLAHSEGQKKADRNLAKEVSTFKDVTNTYSQSQSHTNWISARTPPALAVPNRPSNWQPPRADTYRETPPVVPDAHSDTSPTPTIEPYQLRNRDTQDQRVVRENAPQPSAHAPSQRASRPTSQAGSRAHSRVTSRAPSHLSARVSAQGHRRRYSQATSNAPTVIEHHSASPEQNVPAQPPAKKVRKRSNKKKEPRQDPELVPSDHEQPHEDDIEMAQVPQDNHDGRYRSNTPRLQRAEPQRNLASPAGFIVDPLNRQQSSAPMPTGSNMIPLGQSQPQRQRPSSHRASQHYLPHHASNPLEDVRMYAPAPAPDFAGHRNAHATPLHSRHENISGAGSAATVGSPYQRQESVSRIEIQGMFADFEQRMAAMLGQHAQLQQPRQFHEPRHHPAGVHINDNIPASGLYMSGGNGPAPSFHSQQHGSAIHTVEVGPLPQHHLPSQQTRNPAMQTGERQHTNNASFPQVSQQQFGPRTHSGYGTSQRALTPQEAKMADDNAIVKAMGGSLKFQADMIGFFWPDMKQDDHPEDVANIAGKTHYRHVRDFLDAAKTVIASRTMPEHTVRNNLHQCFKGNAQLWYQSNLSIERRLEVISGEGIDRWEEKLGFFRIQPAEAMSKLQKQTYTTKDMVAGRSPAEWYLKVKRLCQDAGYGHNDENQYVIHAWNLLDSRIRAFLSQPTATTSSDEFLAMMEERKHTLVDVFKADLTSSKYNSQRFNGGSENQGGNNPANANYGYRERSYGSYPPRNSNYQGGNYSRGNPNARQSNANRSNSYSNSNDRANASASQPQRNNPPYSGNRYNNRGGFNRDPPSRNQQAGNGTQSYGRMQGAYHNRPFADDEPGFAIEDDIPTDRAPDFHEQSMIPSHSDAEESLFHSCDNLEHENSNNFNPNV